MKPFFVIILLLGANFGPSLLYSAETTLPTLLCPPSSAYSEKRFGLEIEQSCTQQNKLNGPFRWWYFSPHAPKKLPQNSYKLRVQGQYLNNLATGTWTTFFIHPHYESRVEKTEEFLNGKLVGTTKKFFENGALASETNYRSGLKDGLERHWYRNGQIAYEQLFKAGIKIGNKRTWLHNGEENSNILLTKKIN